MQGALSLPYALSPALLCSTRSPALLYYCFTDALLLLYCCFTAGTWSLKVAAVRMQRKYNAVTCKCCCKDAECLLPGTQFTCFTGTKVQILTLQVPAQESPLRSLCPCARARIRLETNSLGQCSLVRGLSSSV